MYRIIDTAKYWTTLSIILLISTVIAWAAWGLNLGIDFTGGTSMEVLFPTAAERPASDEVLKTVNSFGVEGAQVKTAGDAGYVLRMQHIDNDQRQQILDAYADQGIVEESFSSIGPALGQELKGKAIQALVIVLLAIVGYVSYVFRRVSKGPVPSWMFGIAAIGALVHDVLITIGVFILLGRFYDVQIDAFFITALLTVLGFSVNDTIVVFDRIREGLKDRKKMSFKDIVNRSINSTITRSLNTSITTLLVLFALYLFGGESIRTFVLALIVGITAGTYSSIFVASPMLLLGQKILKK